MCKHISSLHWSLSCFLCQFCSTGVYSNYTSALYICHHYHGKNKHLLNDNLSLVISNVYVPNDGLRHKIGLGEQAVKRSAIVRSWSLGNPSRKLIQGVGATKKIKIVGYTFWGSDHRNLSYT